MSMRLALAPKALKLEEDAVGENEVEDAVSIRQDSNIKADNA
jgi:hypothetical protein